MSVDPNGGADGLPTEEQAEAGYLAARRETDYVSCVRELLRMWVWLPVKGPQQDFIVTRRGEEGLVRVYTSRSRAAAVAAPDVDPAAASRRRFSDLVRGWRHPDIGVVVNPDSDSEFQIPRRLFDRVLRIQEKRSDGLRAGAGVGSPAEPTARTTELSAGRSSAAPVIPIEPPGEIDGFRFAAMADSLDGAGRPVLSSERERVEGPAEKQRIRQYLDAGGVVQLVPGFVTDMFDPHKGDVAPASTRTDGEWIWSDGVGYYLEEYGIAPEPDFYRAIVAAGYVCVPPTREKVTAAGRALSERQRVAGELYQRWRREQSG